MRPLGLAKNSIGTFISHIAVNLLQFALGVMTARLLGPEGKGLLYVLIAWLGLCTQLGGSGLGEASIFFIGKDRKRLPAAFSNVLIATAIITIALWSGGWFFLRYGQPAIDAQFPLWVWSIIAFLVPIQLLQSLLMQVLSAILRIREINIVEVIRVIIQLLVFVILVVVLGEGVKGAVLAYALSSLCAASSYFLLVLHYGERPRRPDWTLLLASLRYGIKAHLSHILGLFTLRLDALLVASLAISGIQAAGMYSVATSLAELLLFIPVSIRLSLFPMVSAGSAAGANRLTSTACRHTMLLTILLALGLGAAGPFAIHRLYGEAFADAVSPLLLLLPGVLMLSQTVILVGDFLGRGKPWAAIISTLLALIVTVILDILLIPTYGITGAAVASLCAYASEFIAATLFFAYYSELPWTRLFVIRKSDLTLYLNLYQEIVNNKLRPMMYCIHR
jgi:O-antigen/teichoic acid export membrane protein